jgi:hypothetical protein
VTNQGRVINGPAFFITNLKSKKEDYLPFSTIIAFPGKMIAIISLSGTGSCGGKDFRHPPFKEDGLPAGQTEGHWVEKKR